MPERPDLRQISHDIGDALAGYDRETLASILTYVFKEYVVQGPPPLRVAPTDQIEDLAGLSFAALITALQTRLDVEELGLFEVDGDCVSVRVDGMKRQLRAGEVSRRDPGPPARAPQSNVAASQAPGPAPSSQERLQQPPQAPPPPSRGLTIASRPQSPATVPPEASPTQPSPQADSSESPTSPPKPTDGDDASVRFSLLEFD